MGVEAVDHLVVADKASQSEEQSKIVASGSAVAKHEATRSLDMLLCCTVQQGGRGPWETVGELGITERMRHDRRSLSESLTE